jgi:hypothetical protein
MTDQSTNLFTSTPAVTDQQQQQAPVNDPLKDLLASIQNEQGQPKYRDIPSALDGLRHAQSFIETLKAEKQALEAEQLRMRSELEKRQSVEDIVGRLANSQGNASTTNTESITAEQVAEMVKNQFVNIQTETAKKTNLQTVNDTLVKRFGDKAGEVLKSKADELGITVKQLGDLAQQSPTAVLAYFPSLQQQGSSPSLNTTAFQQAPSEQDLQSPSKSLLSGASSREQAAYMKAIKEHIHKKYGVIQS